MNKKEIKQGTCDEYNYCLAWSYAEDQYVIDKGYRRYNGSRIDSVEVRDETGLSCTILNK